MSNNLALGMGSHENLLFNSIEPTGAPFCVHSCIVATLHFSLDMWKKSSINIALLIGCRLSNVSKSITNSCRSTTTTSLTHGMKTSLLDTLSSETCNDCSIGSFGETVEISFARCEQRLNRRVHGTLPTYHEGLFNRITQFLVKVNLVVKRKE